MRIVTVSRARYNPQFRGRLIVEGSKARKLLLHAALCLGSSQAVSVDGSPTSSSERVNTDEQAARALDIERDECQGIV